MHMCTKPKTLTLCDVLWTMALFYVCWIVGCIAGWNKVFDGIKDFYGQNWYSNFLKILLCIPLVMLIKYYEKDLKFSLKNMFTGFDLKLFSILFSLLVFSELVMMFIVKKGWNINTDNVPRIFEFLVVGLTEEFICRGWVFNALYSKTDFKTANISQTLYFMFWHVIPYIPLWIRNGAINIEQLKFVLIWNFPACIVLGLSFGYIMKKNGSLWIPILLHASMDYLSYLLYMD